ncbi:MAG TPA: hypothetical protein VMW15_08990 [Terracidiphilus sp.]|jgi:hypothetical protein|nr:hypothetical protein [Terracidiphilus sp.]HUX28209.1 hypothetical protein [Terracidiphilus sp.]
MRRRTTAIVLALVLCLLSATRNAMAQQPSVTFRLELTVTGPKAHSGPNVLVIVKFESSRVVTFLTQHFGLDSLSQSVESWRDAAMDMLCKKLHMAQISSLTKLDLDA